MTTMQKMSIEILSLGNDTFNLFIKRFKGRKRQSYLKITKSAIDKIINRELKEILKEIK